MKFAEFLKARSTENRQAIDKTVVESIVDGVKKSATLATSRGEFSAQFDHDSLQRVEIQDAVRVLLVEEGFKVSFSVQEYDDPFAPCGHTSYLVKVRW